MGSGTMGSGALGSGAGCGKSALRTLLIVFNIFFLIFGVALLGVGAYIIYEYNTNYQFVQLPVTGLAIVILVFGLITMVVAGLGCMGAIKQNPCLLYAFGASVIVIVVVEVIAGIVAFAYGGNVSQSIRESAPRVVQEYRRVPLIQNSMNSFMERFRCCGINGEIDFVNAPGLNPIQNPVQNNFQNTFPNNFQSNFGTGFQNNPVLPQVCVSLRQATGGLTPPRGCLDFLEDLIQSNYIALGAAAVVLALLQILGVAAAFWLARSMGKEGE